MFKLDTGYNSKIDMGVDTALENVFRYLYWGRDTAQNSKTEGGHRTKGWGHRT